MDIDGQQRRPAVARRLEIERKGAAQHIPEVALNQVFRQDAVDSLIREEVDGEAVQRVQPGEEIDAERNGEQRPRQPLAMRIGVRGRASRALSFGIIRRDRCARSHRLHGQPDRGPVFQRQQIGRP